MGNVEGGESERRGSEGIDVGVAEEVVFHVLSFLDSETDLIHASLVCKTLKRYPSN
jgi:hypothetical protein